MSKEEYEAKTVPQLREDLGDRGLPSEGNKAELVDRLVQDDREDAEAKTAAELRDELRSEGEPVSGTKDELVDRVVELDEPETVEVYAGGHVMVTTPAVPTPDAIETCSIHGAALVDGRCPVGGHEGTGWSQPEGPKAREVDSDKTFWPDETRGPASAKED
jgi:hypothetical protein